MGAPDNPPGSWTQTSVKQEEEASREESRERGAAGFCSASSVTRPWPFLVSTQAPGSLRLSGNMAMCFLFLNG